MVKFIIGFVFGIVVCTVGFAGIAKICDNGVSQIQAVAREAVK